MTKSKILQSVLTIFFVSQLLISCNFHPFYKENETVYFNVKNIGNSIYTGIIVYAKDSSRFYVDSTSPTGYSPNSSSNPASVPGSAGVSLGITLSNLKDVKNGVFEVQATMLSGKFLSKEFGVIDGLQTRKKFYVDLRDSTILVR